MACEEAVGVDSAKAQAPRKPGVWIHRGVGLFRMHVWRADAERQEFPDTIVDTLMAVLGRAHSRFRLAPLHPQGTGRCSALDCRVGVVE